MLPVLTSQYVAAIIQVPVPPSADIMPASKQEGSM